MTLTTRLGSCGCVSFPFLFSCGCSILKFRSGSPVQLHRSFDGISLELLLEWTGLVVPCWCTVLVETSPCNLHEGTLRLVEYIFGSKERRRDFDHKAPSSNLRNVELKEFHSSDNPISTMTYLFGVV